MRGNAYFFLFRKNLKVTNIQFGELLALIRSFSVVRNSREKFEGHQFVNAREFRSTLEELVCCFAFPSALPARSEAIDRLAEMYDDIFAKTFVLEPLHGSSTVYVPPSADIDLVATCGYSGYIHSCGRAIYAQPVLESSAEVLAEALDRMLPPKGASEKSFFFAIYADEDASHSDRDHAQDLKNGLDDVKVQVEKFHMGDLSLLEVLSTLKRRFRGRLTIPNPSFLRSSQEKHRNQGGDTSRTLWLIVESAAPGNQRRGDASKYYVCYEQMYVNHNPFVIFDESKPAWTAPTTMPHSLAAAMINLALPHLPRTDVHIAEPFVGTGTIPLEAIKFPWIQVHGGDLEWLMPIVASDNRALFSKSCEELQDLDAFLEGIVELLHSAKAPKVAVRAGQKQSRIETFYANALSTVNSSVSGKPPILRSTKRLAELLGRQSFEQRLVFYVLLRTAVKHWAGVERGSREWNTVLKAEISSLSQRIAILNSAKRRMKARSPQKTPAGLFLFADRYSLGISIDLPDSAGGSDPACRFLEVRSALELPPESFDLVVTDPPYGFNTSEANLELAELYSRVIPAAIRSLKPGGQLILCLPDRSHTGRRSPAFTHKELIIQQVLASSRGLGLIALDDAKTVPSPRQLFSPPFYWEAEKALRRAVVHFRFREAASH